MTDWAKLKVVDLKSELKRRNLVQTGLKEVLVARLKAAEAEDGNESEETVQEDSTTVHEESSKNEGSSPRAVSPNLALPNISEAKSPSPEPAKPASPIQSPKEPSQDVSMDDVSESIPVEAPKMTESSIPPETKDSHQLALPSVEPQEASEDRQKRKRRSQSPPPSATDVARKRSRPSDEHPDVRSDNVATESHESEAAISSSERLQAVSTQNATTKDGRDEQNGAGYEETRMDIDEQSKLELSLSPAHNRDSRFKNLFAGEETSNLRAELPVRGASVSPEVDRDISPALHPATPALYIADIMRPLSIPHFKSHLATLAAPPGQKVDSDVIVDFYIDSIRTHAYVTFANVSAASRVRSSLHGLTWPDEKTRKPLWIDFIPADKISGWVDQETSSGGGRGMSKKWAIYYPADEENHVTTELREEDVFKPRSGSIQRNQPVPPTQPIRQPTGPPTNASDGVHPSRMTNFGARDTTMGRESHGSVPSGPASSRNRPVEDTPVPVKAAANTSRLNDLFQSTTTKPMIYWQPVSKATVNARLDAFDAALSKEAAEGKLPPGSGESNRYSFQDGTTLIDRGPEVFEGIRPPRGYRAPRGGGPPANFRTDRYESGGPPARGGYDVRDRGYEGGGGRRGGYGGGYDSYRGGRGGFGRY